MMLTAMRFAELGKEAWPVDWLETGHVLEECEWPVTCNLGSWPVKACQNLTFVTYKRQIRSAELVFWETKLARVGTRAW